MSELKHLYTQTGETLTGQAWQTYPRPQLRRDSFVCLNGDWDFAVTDTDAAPVQYERTIRVPFCPESLLSGVGRVYPERSTMWYRRTFSAPARDASSRVLLHIGACDQYACVSVNGTEVAKHSGGYDPIVCDITDVLQSDNTVVVRVTDRLSDGILPYGKQRRKRGGMWYTPVSGIWQTVWLECVPKEYVRSLRMDTTETTATITADGVSDGTVTVRTPTGELTVPLCDGRAVVSLDTPRPWSPEDPYLYEFTLATEHDTVRSYFALRTLTVETVDGVPRLCLNGKPYFFHGVLDQGYWSDGLFTPATAEEYERDILAMKSLGFNTLRKHIKIEPERFYYDCDRLGMIVFQDMVNNGGYSFVRDTALPTVGMRYLPDTLLHRNKAARQAFIDGMERTVAQLYNHPCVCYWTIFNEGWGQFCSDEMYRRLKTLDTSRFIDTASGWFSGGATEVDSRHVYFRRIKLRVGKKPLVLSEFGGYSWKPEGHVANVEQTYGYGRCETREEFVRAVRRLYTEEVLPLARQGLSAAVYTQLSDVEDETNGFLSYDRRVLKLSPDEFSDVSRQLCR